MKILKRRREEQTLASEKGKNDAKNFANKLKGYNNIDSRICKGHRIIKERKGDKS